MHVRIRVSIRVITPYFRLGLTKWKIDISYVNRK